MLGGASSSNYMIYIRGFPNNFAYWSDQLGNTDWSYDNVLPYYLKSEGNQKNLLGCGRRKGLSIDTGNKC